MKVLFVEPPKEFWFVMGEYLPPPLGILQLAAYLEQKNKSAEIRVIDCQAHSLDWNGLEAEIRSFDPDIVASSGLATCNMYTTIRTLDLAKKVRPDVLTVGGGQHFTAMAEESLKAYPELDIVVRGEGEETLSELVRTASKGESLQGVRGISFRHNGKVVNNPPMPLIQNLDELPYPAYHLVKDVAHKYHFAMMAGSDVKFMIVEGSRGCQYRCTFCTQWKHWNDEWRTKSAKRIADEMEFCFRHYDARFLWLTDDHFPLDKHASDLCDEIVRREISDKIMWFVQARSDEVVKNKDVLPKMRKAGNRWILMGAESDRPAILQEFKKSIDPKETALAVELLKKNDIFAQLTFILGSREDTSDSIAGLRRFADQVNPDLAIFMILTPFPGTEIFEAARKEGVIEDFNWANYDMVHAIMPTQTLSKKQLQEELYKCYRSFYGSWKRRLAGVLSPNRLKRRTYRYLATRGLLNQLRSNF
ncbi:MAG: B12-binding domain-containing radical SAM protein [Candidatus Bathyarchaeia archaeon]